jgi:hypothetical protein
LIIVLRESSFNQRHIFLAASRRERRLVLHHAQFRHPRAEGIEPPQQHAERRQPDEFIGRDGSLRRRLPR